MQQDFFVNVHLDQSLQKALEYKVPKELNTKIQVGMRVEVPLKNSIVQATIIEIKQQSSFPNPKNLLRILSTRSELPPNQMKLAQWMSHYYVTGLQKVLKCFIPSHARKKTQEKTQIFLTLLKAHTETIEECQRQQRKNPRIAAVLQILLAHPKGIFLTEVIDNNGSASSVQTLIKNKWIKAEKKVFSEDLLLEEDFFPSLPKILNPEQEKCLSSIVEDLKKNIFASHLILGITGSGKTEIYLQAIAHTLETGKSVILLVPEVALTSQTIERFKARFTQKIAILHHKRSDGERNSAWEDLKNNKVQIVIGARSAIFAPVQNVGLIIVDEEHDNSYKQTDETPCYQARDVAVMRGYFEQCVVLLGSATPSMESRYNAEIGKYKLHTLKTRATLANLPKIHIIDMKRALETNGGFTHFSQELLQAIKDRLKKGEQTLLLLNKRGYHRMQLCSQCKTCIKCPHCDLSLTYHKTDNHLKCHICNYTLPPARSCPTCLSDHTLEFKGFGTEHVEKSLHAILPGIRTLRMDRDTTQKKHSHEEIFQQFRSHKADVLIGTQMISKGFHFPSVTLVGVLNLDASLMIPDFKSPEQVFQLLIQTAGRAGRSDLPGEVFIQTFMPEHPIIGLAKEQDFDAFYRSQIEERKMFDYPPFCHMVKMSFFSKDAKEAETQAQQTFDLLQKLLPPTAKLFPITTAGHPKVKDFYRYQFLIKTNKIGPIAPILERIQNKSMKIDVDPFSTFF